MADERYCEIRNDLIVNTCIVDPDSEQGESYLHDMEMDGALMLPEAEATAQYPYAPPPGQ